MLFYEHAVRWIENYAQSIQSWYELFSTISIVLPIDVLIICTELFSLFHYNWEGLNTIMCSQVLYHMLIQFQLLFHPWFPMTCSIPQAYRCTYAQEYTNAGWQHDSWYPRIFWVSVIINCVRPILVVFGWISIAVFSSNIDFIKIIAVVVKIKMKYFA